MVSYTYNVFKLENFYNKQIKNIKLNEFFDIIQNEQFYRKYITYINDYNFQNKLEKIKIYIKAYDNVDYPYLDYFWITWNYSDIESIENDDYICTQLYYHIKSIEILNYRTDFTLEEVSPQIEELKQEWNNWRIEWVKFNLDNKLDYKYNNIFNEINNIKNKYKC